jgi:hypothetical protein
LKNSTFCFFTPIRSDAADGHKSTKTDLIRATRSFAQFAADRLTVSSWTLKRFDRTSQEQHNDAQTSEKKLTHEPLASLQESGSFLTDRTSHLQMKLLSVKLISVMNSRGHIVQMRSDSLQICSWTFILKSHKLEFLKNPISALINEIICSYAN